MAQQGSAVVIIIVVVIVHDIRIVGADADRPVEIERVPGDPGARVAIDAVEEATLPID